MSGIDFGGAQGRGGMGAWVGRGLGYWPWLWLLFCRSLFEIVLVMKDSAIEYILGFFFTTELHSVLHRVTRSLVWSE